MYINKQTDSADISVHLLENIERVLKHADNILVKTVTCSDVFEKFFQHISYLLHHKLNLQQNNEDVKRLEFIFHCVICVCQKSKVCLLMFICFVFVCLFIYLFIYFEFFVCYLFIYLFSML
jgi:hypothetical protein